MKPILDLYAIIFGRPIFLPIHRIMHSMALRGMGVLNYSNLDVSGEYHLLKKLAKLRPDIGTVVDVGANEGDYSDAVSEILKPGRIIAIEAHPKTAARLKVRAKSFKATTQVIECAISDIGDQSIQLFDPDEQGSSHATTIKNALEGTNFDKKVGHTVNTRTLDSLAAELDIARIDLLKIDIEGAELAALKGARKLLTEGRIDVIQFEFNSMNIEARAVFKDFHTLLDNYKLFRLLPRGLCSLDTYNPRLQEIYAFQNIIAVHANSEIAF
jgi:FkbM family methyltransferase